MRLLERPQLTLGYDGNRREHHGPVLTPLKTQRFPGVALAKRDLATLSDDFDFEVPWERFYNCHAIMLSCGRALRQISTTWPAVAIPRPVGSYTGLAALAPKHADLHEHAAEIGNRVHVIELQVLQGTRSRSRIR
jgi:hypothetical protein